MVEKDGAWINGAKIAGGRDINGNTTPLKCEPDGTLDVSATISGIFGPIDVIVDNIVPVSQSGDWTIAVNNFPATQPVSGTVAVSNFPTTQPISGAVSVSNFPSTYPVTGTFWQSTQPVSESNIDKSFGTWAYYSGTSGTVNVTAGQRVTAITCHSTVGGTLTIAGGSTITIPANTSFADNPQGNIMAPTIVFTNTDAYFIEVVS